MNFWPFIKVLPVRTHIHFVRWARLFTPLSALAILGSLWLTLYPFTPPCGGLACGIDFKGGTVLELTTAPKPVDTGQIRAALQGMDLGDIQVQPGRAGEALVRFQTPAGADGSATVARVQGKLTQTLGQVRFTR